MCSSPRTMPFQFLKLSSYDQTAAALIARMVHVQLMPEMNWLDMILELTRAFLNVKVKVIAISVAPDTQNTLDATKLLGVLHTLHKPFSMEALLKTVQYELAN